MIRTERLTLRPLRHDDLDDLAAMNADPAVWRYFEQQPTRDDAVARIERSIGYERDLGFSFWRVARSDDDRFLGLTGLKPLTVPWPEPSDIEIGWSFVAHAWGHGYATEAARAALAFGLARAPRIIAMTVLANRPSWRVMERLGMRRAPELDFDHPDVSDGHPLKPHIVYVRDAA